MAEPARVTAAMPFQLACARPWLVASFAAPHRMASWSVNRPGIVTATRVAWREVANEELVPVRDAVAWFRRQTEDADLADAVGLITARNVACHEHVHSAIDGVRADCVITLGLNNGETVGRRRRPTGAPGAGTINILASVSVPLTDGALLEMSSIVTQARTAALLRFGFALPDMEEPATGTGTDCIVAACPLAPDASPHAGMHTAIGEAVGASVLRATARAARNWLDNWSGRYFRD